MAQPGAARGARCHRRAFPACPSASSSAGCASGLGGSYPSSSLSSDAAPPPPSPPPLCWRMQRSRARASSGAALAPDALASGTPCAAEETSAPKRRSRSTAGA